MNAESGDGRQGFSPREVLDAIVRRGDPARRGLRPYIEALAYARWQNWEKLEVEQYVKLAALLDHVTGEMDVDVAERLWTEITHTRITAEVEVVLHVLLSALEHVAWDSPAVRGLTRAFELRAENPTTAWRTRACVGRFLDRLHRLDAELARERRRHLTDRLIDWSLEYQGNNAVAGFEERTRGMFEALMAAAWTDEPARNVERGLDGVTRCALDKLMQAVRTDWFGDFVVHLSDRLSGMQMYRRLSGATLFAIGELFSETRRRVYERFPSAALAVTTLEEAMHRPRRVQLDRTGVQLEMALPGPRGFDDHGARLRVFDISRDGCLAVIDGAARFLETAPGEAFRIPRGHGRSCVAHRLSGVIQRDGDPLDVRAGTEVILYDGDGAQWAAVDRASIVRTSRDEQNDRLWIGFHFDSLVPEVQQDIEQFVYNAA